MNTKSVNILTNKNVKKNSFLNLKILSFLKFYNLNNDYNLIIKNKFCNNLLNELSSVSIINYNNKC